MGSATESKQEQVTDNFNLFWNHLILTISANPSQTSWSSSFMKT